MGVKLRKVLASLAVLGLSIGGDCFGHHIVPIAQSGNLMSNSVEVKAADERGREVAVDKVKIVDADEDFLEDFSRLKSSDLARKYGTKDGIVYRVRDNKSVFLRYEKSPFERSFFSSFPGDPVEGLKLAQKALGSLKGLWNDSKRWISDFESDPFFREIEAPFGGFSSFIDSSFDRFRRSFDAFTSFDDIKIQGGNFDFDDENSVESCHQTESLDQTEVLFNSEKPDVAKVSAQEKKGHRWLKDASLISAGALVGSSLVVFKTNPEFYKNVITAVKSSNSLEYVSKFCKNAISKVSDSGSWKVISGLFNGAILKIKNLNVL